MNSSKFKKKLIEQYRDLKEDGDFSAFAVWVRLVQSAWYGLFREEEYGDMMSYRFIKLKHPEVYDTMFTKKDNALLLPLVNDEDELPILREKNRFLDLIGNAGRRYMYARDHGADEIAAFLHEGKSGCYVLKDNEGAGGEGISLLHSKGAQWILESASNSWHGEEIEIDAVLSALERKNVLIEEYIEQHDELNRIFPKCVNTVFIHTVLLPDGHAEVVGFPYMQIGYGESRLANSGDDLIIGIHEDGTLYSFGFQRKNWYRNLKKITEHPDTGVVFAGIRIPHWDEALRLACRAAEQMPQLTYVKWDIAIAPDGPILIEGNGMSGAYTVGQTYSLDVRHAGVKAEMSEFLQALAFSRELTPPRVKEINARVKGPWEDAETAGCEAVVVLGSTRAVSRIKRAYELFGQDDEVVYILCGGKLSEYPKSSDAVEDGMLTEADFMRQFLLERGFPETRIIIDNASTNTFENLTCAAKELRYLRPEKVAVVSAWFHGRRVWELIDEENALGLSTDRVCFVPAYGKDTRPDNWFSSMYGVKAIYHEWKDLEGSNEE